MNITDIAKFILYLAISGSVVGISIQIMRLLSAFTDNVKDLRKTTKNLGLLSAGLVEDEKLLRKGIKEFLKIVDRVKGTVNIISEKIIKPIQAISSFLTMILGIVNKLQGKFSKKNN